MYRFLSKRWLDFRNGHNTYLLLAMTFLNFILLSYNLGLERLPYVKALIGGDIVIFAFIFVGVYIPAAMALGYWHRKKQYSVENEVYNQENWIGAWIGAVWVRMVEGKATDKEIQDVLDYAEAILHRHGKQHLIRE